MLRISFIPFQLQSQLFMFLCELFGSCLCRCHEVSGIGALYATLLREHNRVAIELAQLNQHWDDETLFQESRRIVIAQIQHITYNEFLPTLLGEVSCGRSLLFWNVTRCWLVVTDVSGRPVGQVVQEDAIDRLSQNVCTYQSVLRNIQLVLRPPLHHRQSLLQVMEAPCPFWYRKEKCCPLMSLWFPPGTTFLCLTCQKQQNSWCN